MTRLQSAHIEVIKAARESTEPGPLGQRWYRWLRAGIELREAEAEWESKMAALARSLLPEEEPTRPDLSKLQK